MSKFDMVDAVMSYFDKYQVGLVRLRYAMLR